MDKALHARDLAAGDDAPQPRPKYASRYEVSARVFAIALMLSLWLAVGSLTLAIIEGLGEDPLRRLLIGLFFVLAFAMALWQRDAICEVLQARPWLVVLLAAAEVGVVVADGSLESPYKAVSLTSVGLAAIFASPRTVWLCVAVLDLGLAAGILLDSPPSTLVGSAQLAAALGALLGYPFAALVVLGLAAAFLRFLRSADTIIATLRAGTPVLTPALTQALQLGAVSPVRLLPPPSPFADLTPKEIAAVEAIAVGRRPKQIAFEQGVALPTVRKHLRHAKKKTGARTLVQLAAMTKSTDWPRSRRDG